MQASLISATRQLGVFVPANLGQSLASFFGVVPLFLVITIGYGLAQLTWGLVYSQVDRAVGIGQSLSPTFSPTLSHARASQPTVEDLEISRLINVKLFGEYVPAAEPVTPKIEQTSAPKTTLKLELKGVFHGLSGVNSTAIIAQQGQVGELYRIGQEVSMGVTLESVLEDRVILRRRGKLEALYFADEPELKGVQSVSGSSLVKPGAKKAQGGKKPLKEAKSNLGKMIASGQMHSPAQIVEAISSDLDQDPEAALAELGLTTAGSGLGYTVSNRASRDLLRTMGLRAGDKLISINGQSLGDPGSDASQIKSALEGENVRVEIQRGSRRFTVNVDIPSG